MSVPLFSIVITCHNQAEFIAVAVESALAQRNLSKEVIVVDDGSTDGSQEVLEKYARSIELVKLPTNRGAIEARNYGARLAGGSYLVFLDGDDALMPSALDVYEDIIVERAPTIIAARALWFEGEIPRDDTPARRSVQFFEYKSFIDKDRPCGLSASTWVVERAAFVHAGGWTPGIFQLDLVDLATKLSCSGRSILVCEPNTVFYRIHSGNSIHTVPPFLQMASVILRKERASEYPGGRQCQFKRRAWLGGVVFFWIKRALRVHLFREAIALVVVGWPMIFAAVVRRAAAFVRGRSPIMKFDSPRRPIYTNCLEIEKEDEHANIEG